VLSKATLALARYPRTAYRWVFRKERAKKCGVTGGNWIANRVNHCSRKGVRRNGHCICGGKRQTKSGATPL